MPPEDESVSAKYAEIFSRDPLLLEVKNQNEYGIALLHNLLVHRTVATCYPEPVDLHDPNRERAFARPNPTYPSPFPVDLQQRFKNARLLRDQLSEEDFNLLRNLTMVCDGRLTRRRLNTFLNPDAAKADLKAVNARSTLERRLRIATVGFRVKISRIADRTLVNEDLCALPERLASTITDLPETSDIRQLGRTKRLPTSVGQGWGNTIETHIRKALARRSHIVLLPEFALPGVNHQAPVPIEQKILEVSRQAPGDHFLFAGTRHEGGYNRGLIYYKSDGKVSEEWWHYKVASARSLGENIIGPFGRSFPVYRTHFKLADGKELDLDIMVAVCYDAFDPTMFLNLVLQAAKGDRDFQNTVILVPSFNPSDEFVELLRDLSFLAACPVVYVNGLHGDAKMFLCGFALSDLRESRDGLLARLEQVITALEGERLEENRQYKEACRANPAHVRTPQQRRAVEKLRHRSDHLVSFRSLLESLVSSRALDHLITVEHCGDCEGKTHTDDYHCHKDILYYNIDVELLGALRQFRQHYFMHDEFLPRPFRARQLARAAQQMERRRAKRKTT